MHLTKECGENMETLEVKKEKEQPKQNETEDLCKLNYTLAFLPCAQSPVYDYWGLDTTFGWKERGSSSKSELF